MKRYSDLDYLRLSRWAKLRYGILCFFAGIPDAVKNTALDIGQFFGRIARNAVQDFVDLIGTFREGDAKTRLSYLIMGWGCLRRGQIARGLLFMLFEAVFVFYMIASGWYWLSMLPSLGKNGPGEIYDPIYDTYVYQ